MRSLMLAGLLVIAASCTTHGGAYIPPPTRVIAGMTAEQVRDQLVTRCASRGFNVASADPAHIICDREAGIIASALLQTGVGPAPRIQFHAVTAQMVDGVQVTGWQQLQAYTWTGAVSGTERGMNATQRAEVEMVLADLQPITPNAP